MTKSTRIAPLAALAVILTCAFVARPAWTGQAEQTPPHPDADVPSIIKAVPSQTLAPYVPTPQIIVERMLELAEVTADDVVYDLGSGDGRIPITAAEKYGARGVGIDIDAELIAMSRENARRAGVEHLVTFIQEDVRQVDLSEATVVTMYLLTSSNLQLRPKLTSELAPGSRIVSHSFGMGDWAPEKTVSVEDAGGRERPLYLWRTDGIVRD